MQVIAWSITAATIFLLGMFVAPNGDIAEEIVCIVSSLLASISVTVSLFARYVMVEHFPVSAYINIGITYTLSFF